MEGKIGVGIIGAGGISAAHARSYRTFGDAFELVAFADIYEHKAEERAREFGAKAAYQDYREMLKRDDIQMVSVCTPPFEHAKNSIAAAEHGKHVLCEKPMAGSLQECDAMIDAAKKHGVWLSVVLHYLFDQNIREAKALVDSGEAGRPILAVLCGHWWRGPEYYDMWWRGTWELECGGALLNHHCTSLDILLHLLGEPASLTASLAALTHDIEVEDTAVLSVQFRNGALGSVMGTVSSHLARELTRLEVSLERAGLEVDTHGQLKIVCQRSGNGGFGEDDPEAAEHLRRLVASKAPPLPHTGHIAIVQDFLDAIRKHRAPFFPPEQARRTVEMVCAAYKSGTTGERVSLPLQSDDPFYSREGILKNAWRSGKAKSRTAHT